MMLSHAATRPLIVLGSGSATRKAILSQAGYAFEVAKADIDEYALGDRSSADGARELVTLLGNAKADAILSRLGPPSLSDTRLLLTADQVVTCGREILEKPKTEAEARRYLALYASQPCRTVGSLVLTSLATHRRVCGIDTCTIHIDPLPADTVEALLQEGGLYSCAGGLMVEHPLVSPHVRKIEGNLDSVMGLGSAMLESLVRELAEGN